MGNYIKWDLKDYFSNKYIFFICIGAIYLLSAIIPYDSSLFLAGLIHFSFFIILYVSLVFSFVIGTKRVVDSFKNKTFLLESMVPLSVNKILLSKFVLGFIINFLYSFIGIIGLAILLFKGVDVNIFELFEEIFNNITVVQFFRFCIMYIFSILTFMSVVVLGYVISKVIRPDGKGNKIIGVIIWFVSFYLIGYVIGNISVNIDYPDLMLDVIYIVLTLISFFATSWLIENKLEIYN